MRAIVLGGSGKAFCAGADLAFMREVGGYTWEQNRADAETLAEMLWTLYTCPVPVVARIHGDCYAGGLGIASVCDIRVVAEGVNFSLSEARLGLLPATISPYVVRAMGEQAARRYFVTAERFGAAEAKAMGFAHEVTTADALDAKVEELVAALVANGPMATRACKKLVQDVAGREITPELRAETARRIADIRASAEGKEGVSSFLEKRKPSWLPAMNLDLTQLVAIAAALGWASGLRLYAVVFLTGAAGALGWIDLPGGLRILQNPWLLGASGVLLFVEFFVDKIPGLDSVWDALHTVIRIPAGAALAAAVFGGDEATWTTAAALLGGGLAATSHIAKATTRAAANTSPEPFSNIALSLLGDGLVPFVLWLSWEHPVLLFVTLGVALLVMLATIWVLGRFLRRAASAVALRYRRPMPPAAHSEVTR